MSEILLWLWTGWIAWGMGLGLLRLLLGPSRTLDLTFPALGLGYGALSVQMLVLGLSGLYRPAWILGLLIAQSILILIFLRMISRNTDQTRHFRVDNRRNILPFSTLEKICLPVIGLLSIKNLLGALSPESRHDVLDYHLNFPNLYLLEGGIYETPWHVFSYMPFYVEMLFTLALAISTDVLSKLMSFGFSLVALGAILQYGCRYFGRRTALWAGALWLLNPWISFLTSTAYIETALSMWQILAVGTLLLFLESLGIIQPIHPENTPIQQRFSWRWCLLSGLFTGLALGSKYTVSLLFCVPLGLSLLFVLILYRKKAEGAFGKALGALLLLTGVSLLIASPWLIRNAVWTGNPVYPIMNARLGLNDPVSRAAEEFFLGHMPEQSPWNHPIQATTHRLMALSLDGTLVIHLLIPLVPLTGLMLLMTKAAPGRQKNTQSRDVFLGVFMLLVFLHWLVFTGNQDGRFMLPAFPVFSWLTAEYYLRVFRWLGTEVKRKSLQTALALFLTLLLMGNYVYTIQRFYQDLGESHLPVLSRTARDRFFERRYPHHAILRWMDRELPADAKILGVGYPATRPYLSHVKGGRHPIEARLGRSDSTPDQLAQAMQKEGLSHVLHPGGVRLPNFTREQWESAGFRAVFQSGRQTVYQAPE